MQLRRSLEFRSLTGLGVGGIIGTGIFVMVGIAARDKAGPALTLSFLLAAVACIAVALCYAESAAIVPAGGSAYAYATAALGRPFGWIIGWNLISCYLLGAASVAQGWSHYCQDFFAGVGLHLPSASTAATFDYDISSGHIVSSGAFMDLPAVLGIAIMTLVILRGIRVSLGFNAAMLVLKLAVIAFVVLVGAFYVHPINWRPFAPLGWLRSAGPDGHPTGVLPGAALVFYAFIGFDVLSAYSEESKRPRRDIPLSIIASVMICAILYSAVAAVLTGMVPYDKISVDAPVSDAFRQVGLPWAQMLIALGALIGITSVLLVILLTMPRIVMAIGRDRLLPQFLNHIHPRYGTPWKSMLVGGALSAIVSGVFSLRVLADVVTMAMLLGYLVVCLNLFVLRRKFGGDELIFRVPWGPTVPLIGAATCLGLMISLPMENWLRLGIWFAVGFAVYVGYGRRNLPKADLS